MSQCDICLSDENTGVACGDCSRDADQEVSDEQDRIVAIIKKRAERAHVDTAWEFSKLIKEIKGEVP